MRKPGVRGQGSGVKGNKSSGKGQIDTTHRGRFVPRFRGALFTIYCLLFVLSPSHAGDLTWDIEDALKAYMHDNYPWGIIEISNVKTGSDFPSEAPQRIKVVRGPLGNAVFSFEFNNARKVSVEADITAFDNIVKSKRSLSKGHVITDDDIYSYAMDITKMPGAAVKDPEEIIGKPLKRSISANIPIAEDIVEKSPVVKKGTKVTLLIEAQGFSIATSGRLKEKGHIGAPVKVINMASKKDVSGVLIDESTVRVEF